MTIHSRIAEMKVLAAHLAAGHGARIVGHSSRFVTSSSSRAWESWPSPAMPPTGSCKIPMNGVLFWRLIQLLDAEQYDSRRKVFIVLDEFPILAGDQPCPGIHDLFTRLRSRGVTVLITYQAHATLKRVYGDATANIVGLCANVIYLRQADVESAKYAADDLGWERGWETRPSWQHGGPHGSIVTMHEHWYDRPIFSQTELRQLLPARRDHGVSGKALSAELECARRRHADFKGQRRNPEGLPDGVGGTVGLQLPARGNRQDSQATGRHPGVREAATRGLGTTLLSISNASRRRNALSRSATPNGAALLAVREATQEDLIG